MPWASFETGNKFCVHKVDADGNKTGEALGCHPSRGEAQAQVAALYSKEKAGARHSHTDNDAIQKAHDLLCELGAACKAPSDGKGGFIFPDSGLSIFKDSSGRYRWVTFSSSAFQDKDREIISTKALADDVARADSDGEYGPLLWWHVKGAQLGACDFNAMEGRVLIESGTFDDEEYGERLKAYADEIEVSIGYYHPPNEPDSDGTYHHIRRFERSLLPKGKASNLLTRFVVKELEIMEKEKEDKLRKWLGPLANTFLGAAETVQKEAEESGQKFKAEDAKPEEKPAAPAEGEAKPAYLTEADMKAYMAKCMEPYVAELEGIKSAISGKQKAEDEGRAESVKAATELATALKGLQDSLTTQGDALKLALEGVAELKGERPRNQTQGYFRASEDGKEPGEKFKNLGPQQDPLAPFMNAILNQPQGQQ